MLTRTPEDTDLQIAAAINVGDVNAALEFYEPNASFEAEPGHTVTGTDAIREA